MVGLTFSAVLAIDLYLRVHTLQVDLSSSFCSRSASWRSLRRRSSSFMCTGSSSILRNSGGTNRTGFNSLHAGKTMAINSSNISADDNTVILFPFCSLNTMKICLGFSLELHRDDAILMKFHDILGGYCHR